MTKVQKSRDFKKFYKKLIRQTGGKFEIGEQDTLTGHLSLSRESGEIVIVCPKDPERTYETVMKVYLEMESQRREDIISSLRRFAGRVEKLASMGYDGGYLVDSDGRGYFVYYMDDIPYDKRPSIETILRDFGEL